MRDDSIGLFWEDLPTSRERGGTSRPLAPIPATGWLPPGDFPNLFGCKIVSFDCETKDPNLLTHGPGWGRGDGHIVGIALGAEGGGRWYFPIRHEVMPELNMDPGPVIAFVKDILENPRSAKIGANIGYDIGWLGEEGINVKGPLVDVQYAQALLSEEGRVDLDWLAQLYLGEHKDSSLLYKWCSDSYGGAISGKQRANIYRAPPSLVGPYAQSDADLPLRLIGQQAQLLEQQGLLELFRMECELIPLYVAMRRAGASVNIPEAERVRDVLRAEQDEYEARIRASVGFSVNVNAAASCAKAFDVFGIPYPRTKGTKNNPQGKPSFKQEFLDSVDHPIGDLIRQVRKRDKLRGTFVESYILNSNVKGKVYTSFHPLRGEKGGTRSGRYSSDHPNLQNIPSRDKILAPMIRGIFGPDDGHRRWRRFDYSQIEYRFLAHFAVGPMSQAVRQIYNANPHTDYHDMTIDLIRREAGFELDRKPAKNINFGFIYGMGVPKLIRTLGLTQKQGKDLFKAYHAGAPYAAATMEWCSEEAAREGYITTILGRRSRFELFEPAERSAERKLGLPYQLAVAKYGYNVKRAYLHKALNRRLQGSAADQMKRAMWQCYKDGIFTETGVPRLTVHDELDFSDTGESDAAFDHMRHILETCIPLRVPVVVDMEAGPDWGHCEKLVQSKAA